VEQEGVLLMFGSPGTGVQTAVQKYLNAQKVPQLFITASTLRLVDPRNFPWTMVFPPNQRTEVAPLAQYLLSHRATAKIGVLYERRLWQGFRASLEGGFGGQGAAEHRGRGLV
jgi:branched-chain amino acid transport system substrate-binding protein